MKITDYMEYWTGPINAWAFGYYSGLNNRNQSYHPDWDASDRESYDQGWGAGMTDRIGDTIVALGRLNELAMRRTGNGKQEGTAT